MRLEVTRMEMTMITVTATKWLPEPGSASCLIFGGWCRGQSTSSVKNNISSRIRSISRSELRPES